MGKYCLNASISFAAALVCTLAAPAQAIDCSGGFQHVQGSWIATPYCQDEQLAQVARQYGFRAAAAEIRHNPNVKKEICRFISQDIRVQTTCLDAGVPESFGGGGR